MSDGALMPPRVFPPTVVPRASARTYTPAWELLVLCKIPAAKFAVFVPRAALTQPCCSFPTHPHPRVFIFGLRGEVCLLFLELALEKQHSKNIIANFLYLFKLFLDYKT